jgi:beta-glucosidase/6-phospho-beta-glucosidase/beta-galactosidase
MAIFNTFFMGGFECADMINNRRKRVDLLHRTRHDTRVEEDYQRLTALGIRTVREGVRWSMVEKAPYTYDFSEVRNRIKAAQQFGIQQLWDICHFGYPDDLAPTAPSFCERFVAICKAFTELYRSCTNDPLIIIPINEISFISWLSGDVAGTVPFLKKSASLIKYQLCRATIQAIKAIKRIDSTAKILLVEPLIRVHPKEGKPISKRIREYNEGQFEVMDIITGQLHPELGGRPDYMDLAGFNYYYNNQWEHRGKGVCWKKEKARRDFPGLIKEAADRYRKPVVLSETGHFNDERCLWMQQITEECITAMEMGVDLQGICIYPVLDRPDWDRLTYINCGIWGYDEKTKERFEEAGYKSSVQYCMTQIESFLSGRNTVLQQPSI